MEEVEAAIHRAHQETWSLILASVVRSVRDLDLAEDVVQDAFVTALAAWRREGIPATPAAWLITTARRKALDRLRREASFARKLPLLIVPDDAPDERDEDGEISDERLRLVFTCCHPALAIEARVALTLRLVCGLATPEVARLFLVSESTMAARITRAKKKIAAAGIPYRVPAPPELPERLPAVLTTIYLVFTEGYTASDGDHLLRPDLIDRALALGRMLAHLLPDEPEVLALLALMRLTDSRRAARTDGEGHLVRLAHQDRAHWDRQAIAEGITLVEQALRRTSRHRPGRFALEAAIAAIHAEAPSFEETDWPQMLALYDILLKTHPSPVVELNRTVPLSMVAGPEAALREVDRLITDGALATYPYLFATRADLLVRLGRNHEARHAFRHATHLTANHREQAYLATRAETLD